MLTDTSTTSDMRSSRSFRHPARVRPSNRRVGSTMRSRREAGERGWQCCAPPSRSWLPSSPRRASAVRRNQPRCEPCLEPGAHLHLGATRTTCIGRVSLRRSLGQPPEPLKVETLPRPSMNDRGGRRASCRECRWSAEASVRLPRQPLCGRRRQRGDPARSRCGCNCSQRRRSRGVVIPLRPITQNMPHRTTPSR